MSDSPIFELVCERLQTEAGLSRSAARGTMRLLLKEVGLDPQLIRKDEAIVVIDRFLEQALRVRGVAEAAQVQRRVMQAVRTSELGSPEGDDPEAIFRRITLRQDKPGAR